MIKSIYTKNHAKRGEPFQDNNIPIYMRKARNGSGPKDSGIKPILPWKHIIFSIHYYTLNAKTELGNTPFMSKVANDEDQESTTNPKIKR